MFDFSFDEMLLAGVIALIVLGPERLPKVAQFAGKWLGKIQRTADNVKNELLQQAQYAELAKIKQDLQQAEQEFRQEAHHLRSALAENLPAWDRLPEQRKLEDFIDNEYKESLSNPISMLRGPSLKKQAMARKRSLRPRYLPKPKLRCRR